MAVVESNGGEPFAPEALRERPPPLTPANSCAITTAGWPRRDRRVRSALGMAVVDGLPAAAAAARLGSPAQRGEKMGLRRGKARSRSSSRRSEGSNPLSSTRKSAQTALGSRRPQSLDYLVP